MNKQFKIGILVIVLLTMASIAMAGFQGPIEKKKIENTNLSLDKDIGVIITLKEEATDESINILMKKIGKFKIRAKNWNKIYPKGFAAEVNIEQMSKLFKEPSVARVDLDKKMQIQLDTANYWSGTTKARSLPPTGYNVTGDRDGLPHNYSKNDVVIAILDTGIDPMHKDLTGVDNGGTSKIIGWADVIGGVLTPYDDNGHGTHVASIAAGEGDSDPAYIGVAPGAALVGVKVLDSGGWGTESNVISGVNWVVANKEAYNIRIMSLSLGSSGSSDGTDPISVALGNAFSHGISVVVAAGNNGPQKYTIGSPAATSNAITVGTMADVGYLLKSTPAVSSQDIGILKVLETRDSNITVIDSGDMPKIDLKPPERPRGKPIKPAGALNLEDNGFYLAPFSSRGPTADNKYTKPDVVAPGVSIMAAQGMYPNTPTPHDGYVEYSGTSMSTPFVSGVIALMLDANNSLTPAEIKNIIRTTAEDYGVTGCDIDYGCGRLRAYKAIGWAATRAIPITDQWVPTHYRIYSYINDSTISILRSIYVYDANYPLSTTLIMKDWSGYNNGIDLSAYVNNPLGNFIANSISWGRQENLVIGPDYKGYHNVTIVKGLYWYGWIYISPGSGYYTLDISKK